MKHNKRDDRKRLICDQFEKLLQTTDFKKISMQSIADKCSLAVGTLYNYYPSKKQLLTSLFLQKVYEIIQETEEIARKNRNREKIGSLNLMLREVIQSQMRFFTLFSKEQFVMLLAEIAQDRDLLRSEGQVWGDISAFTEQLHRFLEPYKGSGYLSGSIDITELSKLLFNLIYIHFRDYIYSEKSMNDIEQSLFRQVSIVMTGLHQNEIKNEEANETQ